MRIQDLRILSKEEKKKLQKNRYVESVGEHAVVLTLEFHSILYEHWKDVPNVYGIQETMRDNGIEPEILGNAYAEALAWDFQTYGDPSVPPVDATHAPYTIVYRRNDVVLLALGMLYVTGRGMQWDKEFRRELRTFYPEMSIEDGFRKAGIDPALVGKIKIHSLKHHFDRFVEQKRKSIDGTDGVEEQPGDRGGGTGGAYRYKTNPYVEEVTGRYSLLMREQFFNEVYYMEGIPIREVLAIYGIDASILSRACISQMINRRSEWKLTEKRCGEWTEEVCRIQAARLPALCRCVEDGFKKIRELSVGLSPIHKKQLCQIISGYPTKHDHPCGYSFREILCKVGIPKTVYYKALSNGRYGLADKIRKEKDALDLEKLIWVVEYKGFEKGIRQIYMMMPDLTGETFAISKIRRLLRGAGIRTKVRRENPARQRMGAFMEKNRKPNLLKREFRLHRPNEVRLTDVTYLEYGGGEEGKRAYASSCIDPVTGKLLAFHVSENNDLELALGTLGRLSEHPTVEGALFHSDQGILYFSDEFQKKVEEMGMVQSMSRRGNCWDNAPQESFFGHFKDECGYEACQDFGQLESMIEDYAWYYNNERRQWNRNRMTPAQYEEHLLSLDEAGFAEYMESEREKYDKMKAEATKKAMERAKEFDV